jgi:hypothetical protein
MDDIIISPTVKRMARARNTVSKKKSAIFNEVGHSKE